ncbi:MAG: hypothetical protein JWO36_3098 [Myxococcales bacterium]|nr:hypothetical protein [Myxococcales bacterium]
MANDGLQKQVMLPPDQSPELVAMKRKIDRMQGLYVALFMTSLVVLVLNWSGGMPASLHLVWALSLGGAVITRVTRSSLVAKYNSALLGGGPAPLT